MKKVIRLTFRTGFKTFDFLEKVIISFADNNKQYIVLGKIIRHMGKRLHYN